MHALEALHTRNSSPRLATPAPDATALDNIFRAALRAADHGLLRPWRFLVIRDDSLHKLGDLFVEARRSEEKLSEDQAERLRQKPLRAPMIIVTVSSPAEHPKVPEFEQDLSAAAATQNMLLAAHAQGLGAMWRTGALAYHPVVKRGLGLNEQEKIIGFLYLGTQIGPQRPNEPLDPARFVTEW